MTQQQLNLRGTVAIGIASMVGAGVFVVFREATALAGSYLWLAMLLAAAVASLNAASVYQLASLHDRPGGVYAYARVYLNDTWSFIAGFSFVFGKIGSIAAIALVLGEYLAPLSRSLTASLAIIVMTAVNVMGINRTATAAKVLATITLIYFTVAAVVGIYWGGIMQSLSAGFATGTGQRAIPLLETLPSNVEGLLPAAAVLFFAFAGYARVATLGNEVIDAKRNIPKAIRRSLLLVIVLYFALAFALVTNFGADLATQESPFLALYKRIFSFFPMLAVWLTQAVAVAACLGSILALLAGVSRTAATMAEDRELPAAFEKRNRFGSPWLAEIIIAVGSILLLQFGNLTWVIGFSSLSVLLYYAIGHFSALRQPSSERKVPKILGWIGLVLCAALLVAVPGPALWVSALILAVAIGWREVARRRARR